VVACLLQRSSTIQSAGGYLRELTRKAGEREFSLGPILMAQINAKNSRPLAKALASWILAMIADAVTGPTPGRVINRLAVSSVLTDAASSLSIAPIAPSRASIWPTSERSAPRTQSGTTARHSR
jgi:Replication protein C C-terminal region